MDAWEKIKPFLAEAHNLLLKSFKKYMGADPRGHFDVSNLEKARLITDTDLLGTFDAWADCISLNTEQDPLGTAVHELLHANAFSDDWLPQDTGRPNEIISFRGFEIQRMTADRSRAVGIYHRAINEAVTEFLTTHVYPEALPAYVELIPFAKEVEEAIGFEVLVREYFCDGYPGLEAVAEELGFNLAVLDVQAERALLQHRANRRKS